MRKIILLIATIIPITSANAACNSGNYFRKSDGILARNSGLVWSRCVTGKTGPTCKGEATLMTFQEAETIAKSQPGWRIPTRDELMTLIEQKCKSPRVNSSYFPNIPTTSVWSKTPSADNNGFWTVDLIEGYDDIAYRGNNKALLLVK